MVMNIQTDNISFKGYDARPLKGFLLTSNYGNIAQELKNVTGKYGVDVFVLRKNEMTKDIPPANLREYYTDIWAQDLWTVTGKRLLNFYKDTADKRTEIFKNFFNLSDSATQMSKRANLINFDTKELEHRLYIGIEDDRLLPKFNAYYDGCEATHIAGGNIFLTKADNGKNNLIIGEDEIKKFSSEELKTMYNAGKICFLPQLDYHLDLFIRPLNNNVVLLADELMTERLLKTFVQRLDKYISELPKPKTDRTIASLVAMIKNFSYCKNTEPEKECPIPFYKSVAAGIKNCIDTNGACRRMSEINTSMIEEKLTKSGYKVVRVPASINKMVSRKEYCEGEGWYKKKRCLNYMNACAFLNKNNEIVYITNKDMLDTELKISHELKQITGIDIEEEFKKSVKNYIKPENIYFLSGDGKALGNALLSREGGLHCMATEIPVE